MSTDEQKQERSDEEKKKIEKEQREQKIQEYESVIGLMQDTGQAVWVINGTYVLALTVLVGVLANLLSQRDVDSLQLWIAVGGAVLSLVVVYLWWASFERNYAFYNLRIHIARTLEATSGFSLLNLGAKLSKGEEVTVIEGEPLQIPRLASKGIQFYTECLIGVFAVVLVSLLVIGIWRLAQGHCLPVVRAVGPE